jgi:hypothetical protein
VVYDTNLLTAYAMLGLIAFTMNCNSPRSLMNELLQLLTFPSGFGSSGLLGSNGMPTGLCYATCL